MKSQVPLSFGLILGAAVLGIAIALPGAAVAGNLHSFKLQNASGYDLTELRVSPSLEDNWSEDVLGSERLASGAVADVSVAGQGKTCFYDIRFVAADGSLLEEVGVDLCTIENYTLNP
ncbi:MAG: hypothetical protein EXQ98_07715 [Alphaproteobacteria bacterium]|nr:hypothetical protein [Alphaproteobacteria bacterium]